MSYFHGRETRDLIDFDEESALHCLFIDENVKGDGIDDTARQMGPFTRIEEIEYAAKEAMRFYEKAGFWIKVVAILFAVFWMASYVMACVSLYASKEALESNYDFALCKNLQKMRFRKPPGFEYDFYNETDKQEMRKRHETEYKTALEYLEIDCPDAYWYEWGRTGKMSGMMPTVSGGSIGNPLPGRPYSWWDATATPGANIGGILITTMGGVFLVAVPALCIILHISLLKIGKGGIMKTTRSWLRDGHPSAIRLLSEYAKSSIHRLHRQSSQIDTKLQSIVNEAPGNVLVCVPTGQTVEYEWILVRKDALLAKSNIVGNEK